MNARETSARAYRFLTERRTPWRGWSDFELAPGESDHWVSAYIASAIFDGHREDARTIAKQVWTWLIEQRQPMRGWGYNASTPHDADSTIWALQLARRLGASHWAPARDAARLLRACERQDGGITTYPDDVEIRAFIHAPTQMSFHGWCSSHVCVSAAAALLEPTSEALLKFLLERQRPDGSWRSYWWIEDEYATALAARAIAARAPDAVERAIRWGVGRVREDGSVRSDIAPRGSAFACALVIQLLLLRADRQDVRHAIERAVDWLVRHARSDGSWQGCAGLRVPFPDMLAPDTYEGWKLGHRIEGAITLDQNNLFTTATALRALDAWTTSQNTNHEEAAR